jgi:hypothetical protein
MKEEFKDWIRACLQDDTLMWDDLKDAITDNKCARYIRNQFFDDRNQMSTNEAVEAIREIVGL